MHFLFCKKCLAAAAVLMMLGRHVRAMALSPRLRGAAVSTHARRRLLASSSSVDDSLQLALAQAAAAIQAKDPKARQIDGGALKGATLTKGPKMVLRFTCSYEGKEAPKTDDVSRVTTCARSSLTYLRTFAVAAASQPYLVPTSCRRSSAKSSRACGLPSACSSRVHHAAR